jgi:hypothetical protein
MIGRDVVPIWRCLGAAVFVTLAIALVPVSTIAESAGQSVTDFVESELVPLGSDPLIVESVRAENEQGKTLDQIKILDEGWRMTEGVPDFMRGWIDSDCGSHLQEIASESPELRLLWVADRLGTNVAMTDRVPTYWHGEEQSFNEAYRSGAGDVYIGAVAPDPTTGRSMATACVPVMGHGVAIGVVCAVIDVDGLERGSS